MCARPEHLSEVSALSAFTSLQESGHWRGSSSCSGLMLDCPWGPACHVTSRPVQNCIITVVCVQLLWTFSIYLEAVAILPQLVLLQRTQNIDNLTGNYVFLLG